MFKSGYIAILGWPNVGKSTLLNALLGQKLSIVTSKAQTTRDAILGIATDKDAQMIFLDTPGWLKAADAFQSKMKKAIHQCLHDDAELIVWVLEPKPVTEEDLEVGRILLKTKKPLFVVMNKFDLAGPNDADKLKEALESKLESSFRFFCVSAKSKKGIGDLRKSLKSALPEHPPYFPEDQITDRWERFYVSELIREKIFEQFEEEVPHASLVVIDEFKEQEGRKDHVVATIYVETEGQKGILIGKRGSRIKRLGEESRKEIEKQLGRPLFLELKAKVKKNWRKDKVFLNSNRY